MESVDEYSFFYRSQNEPNSLKVITPRFQKRRRRPRQEQQQQHWCKTRKSNNEDGIHENADETKNSESFSSEEKEEEQQGEPHTLQHIITVTELIAKSQEFTIMQDCTSGGVLWGINFWQEEDDDTPLFHEVVVAVEATAICGLQVEDTCCRPDQYNTYPTVYGTNFVGIVHHCDPSLANGLEPGVRVAAIAKWGSNSRHVSIAPDRLWVVPQNLDAADIACVLSAYLPAFCALHHGRTHRYAQNVLLGRRVLVTGGMTMETQALVRLAKLAGVEEVYIVADGNETKTPAVEKRVHLLTGDDWLSLVRGRMDLVVDYAFPRNFGAVREALARRGRLVCVPKQRVGLFHSFLEQFELSTMKRATMLDFAHHVSLYRESVWEDLSFLLRLLHARQIRPRIDRYISLHEIPQVHRDAMIKPLSGAVVCEPWKGHFANSRSMRF